MVSTNKLEHAANHFHDWRENPSDSSLFQIWIKSIYPRLYKSAFTFTGGDRYAAEDAVQDVIVKFVSLNHWDKYPDENHVIRVLLRSIHNRAIDSFRRTNKEQSLGDYTENLEADLPQQQVELDQKVDHIEKTLTGEDREMLTYMIAGESLSEISKLLDISYSNAAVRKHRIRKLINDL